MRVPSAMLVAIALLNAVIALASSQQHAATMRGSVYGTVQRDNMEDMRRTVQQEDSTTTTTPTAPPGCITSDNPSDEERRVQSEAGRGGNPSQPFPPAPAIINHGIFFHIFHATDGTGMATQAQLDSQVAQLNKAFSGGENHGLNDVRVRFFIQGVAYYEDDTLFYNCGPDTELKEPYAVTTDIVLNVYTCTISWIMGDSTMPGSVDPVTFQPLPNNNWRYGIRLHYAALYGGGLANLDSGDVLTHEIGHFYGLFHPYQDSCAPGAWSDLIADTPRMKQNLVGSCAANQGTRSCAKLIPNNPPDDISNYMIGTYDSCRNHFTAGQVAFMQNSIALNKPQLVAMFTTESIRGTTHGKNPTSSQPPSSPPVTATPTIASACQWKIIPGVVGSPIQTDMACQLPLRIGKKTYTSVPPTLQQQRPFMYTSVSSMTSASYWCTPTGTTTYSSKGSSKYLWGPAQCV